MFEMVPESANAKLEFIGCTISTLYGFNTTGQTN